MNRVILIGRTTKDIELRYTQSQKAVTVFTLAVNRRPEGADFIQCEAWENRARLLEKYVKKGDRLGVTGHLRVDTFEKDGQRKTSVKVIVDDLEFLANKHKEVDESPHTADIPQGFEAITDDDLPFV